MPAQALATPCPPAVVENTARSRFLGTAPLPSTEFGQVLGLAADSRYVYATYHRNKATDGHDSPAAGELVVFDAAALTDAGANPEVARLPVGFQPRAVAVNPRTGKVYVLNWGQQGDHPYSVFVIQRSSAGLWSVIARLSMGGGISDIAVNAQTNKVYVSNWMQAVPGASVTGKIHVIDGATDTELTAQALSVVRPLGIAVDESTGMLYAALGYKAQPQVDAVAEISCGTDGATLSVNKIVNVAPTSGPLSVAVLAAPGVHRLYLASVGSTPTGSVPPNLTRFELSDRSFASKQITTAFGGPVALAVNPGSKQVYVTTNRGFQVLDAESETISPAQTLGPFPQSVAVDGSGRVHVGDGVDGTLATVLPVVTSGPVGEHWQALGGAGGFGLPVTGFRAPGNDPRAGYQVFEQGAIFVSTDHGAVALSRELTRSWETHAARPHPGGGSVQQFLGAPVEPAMVSSVKASFQRGLVFLPPAATPPSPFPTELGAGSHSAPHSVRSSGTAVAALPPDPAAGFAVIGEIYTCYVQHSTDLGAPLANEELLADSGLRQRFEQGEICWRADLGAHAVFTYVWDWWGPSGPLANPLGYPTLDITSFAVTYEGENGPFIRTWHSGAFERGTIYWMFGSEQAHTVRDDILHAYETQFGGPKGKLGRPIGDEEPTPTSGGLFQDFENGVIVWHPPGHPHEGAHMFRSAELRFTSFRLRDENDGPLGGDLDLFVRAVAERADTPGGQGTNLMNRRYPEDGDYDSSDHSFDQAEVVVLADVLRGRHEFQIMFAGYDADTFGSDDRMGAVNHGLVHPPWNDDPYNWEVRPAYSVDNLWGLLDPEDDHQQFHFTVTYNITEKADDYDKSLPFRQQWWWKVNNFITPKLTLEQYATTFADVGSSSNWFHINPFDYVDDGFEALYYHLFYKSICEPGNCFGMSLEAIYAMKGRSLFTEPIYRLGNPQAHDADGDGNADAHRGEPDPVLDRDLIAAFNLKHGYQLGQSVVGWFLRQFGQGLTHNPMEVFIRSKEAYDKGNTPLLNFSRNFKFKAHTVLPVHWVGGPDAVNQPTLPHWGEIWIADPKHEWGRDGAADSPDLFKVIIHHDGGFEYDGQWAGGDWGGDRMFYIPFDKVDRVPNLPSWDVLMELGKGMLAFVVGDGIAEQVTDGAGRVLFQPALGRPPIEWSDIEPDVASRIPDLVPIPTGGDENDPLAPQQPMFYGEGADVTHTYSVTGGGAPYRWALRTAGLAAVVTAPSGRIPDQLTGSRLGTPERAITYAIPPDVGGAPKTIAIVLDGRPRSPSAKQFLIDELTVVPKQRVTTTLRDGGRELLITNTGPATTLRLRMRPQPGTAPTVGRQVPLAANKTTRLRPADWSAGGIGSAPIRVEVRDTLDGPPTQCFEV